MTARRTVLAGASAGVGTLLTGAQAQASANRPVPTATGWERLPDLPPNRTNWSEHIPVTEPYWTQIGLAGPVAGAHDDYLIVGGGANFPEPARTSNRQPMLGKAYWNDAFVLRRARGGYEWLDARLRLDDAIGYAACVSTEHGVLVIGGEGFRGGPNGSAVATVELFADVFLLSYAPASKQLRREDLPPLPRPMSYGTAARVGEIVYVAEGSSFYALDLTRPHRGWAERPSWPGDPRTVAVSGSDGESFYLLSGRGQLGDGSWRFYTDAYAYRPGRGWRRVADLPWCVTAGLAVGDRRGITVYAGDRDIKRWNLIQELTAVRDEEPPDSAEWQRRNDVLTWVYDHHTGFNTELLRYDTRRDRWSVSGSFTGASQVTTPAIEWDGDTIIVSGEIRPGIRTPTVWRIPRRR